MGENSFEKLPTLLLLSPPALILGVGMTEAILLNISFVLIDSERQVDKTAVKVIFSEVNSRADCSHSRVKRLC